MIIEGLLTTTARDGSPHVAPMGPVVDVGLETWTLRPFDSSTTFRNLRTNPYCVFHVVDDVLPVVEAALGLPTSLAFERLVDPTEQLADRPPSGGGNSISSPAAAGKTQPIREAQTSAATATSELVTEGASWTIPSACHWYQLKVTHWDTSQPRSLAQALLIDQRVQRPFWGWNRAKHAILEATILASRLQLLDRAEVDAELSKLELAIGKTAGERELQAWQLLKDFFEASA